MPTHGSNDTVQGGLSIYLQSKDGETSENGSKCDFFLETIIDAPRADIGMIVSVLDAEIPYSWYNISDEIGNNTLVFRTNVLDIPVTLPERNYNAYNIADEFSRQFKLPEYTELANLVMTFDENANKFTILSPTEITIVSSTMSLELGMTNLPQTTVTYTSNQSCNLAGTSSVYIRSENMNIKNINSFGKTNGVLSKVLVNSAPGNFIFFEPSTPQYYILGNALSFINIALKDDNDNYLDFNGLGWSLTLSIEYFRKRTDSINYRYFLNSVNDDDKPRPTMDSAEKPTKPAEDKGDDK